MQASSLSSADAIDEVSDDDKRVVIYQRTIAEILLGDPLVTNSRPIAAPRICRA
jgi:hypothetical protein